MNKDYRRKEKEEENLFLQNQHTYVAYKTEAETEMHESTLLLQLQQSRAEREVKSAVTAGVKVNYRPEILAPKATTTCIS